MKQKLTLLLIAIMVAGVTGGWAQSLPSVSGSLLLHLDATEITGLDDGDKVPTWEDLSSPAYDVTQTDVNNQPIYIENGLKGKPVVRFDGSSDLLTNATIDLTTGTTVFIVARAASLSQPNNSGIFATALSQPEQSWQIALNANNTYSFRYTNDSDVTGNNVNFGTVTTDPTLFTVVIGTPDGAFCYLNGSQQFNATDITQSAYSQFRVGANRAAQRFHGDVAEILVYESVLIQSDIELIEEYLREKWFAVMVYDSANNFKTGHNTIQAAIDATSTVDGDIVEVSAGTYTETVTIDKKLTVTGDTDNPKDVTIDGDGTGTVVTITASDVTFEGFTVQNSGAGNVAGLALVSVEDCLIQNNIVKDNAVGIAVLEDSQNNKIQENVVEDNSFYGVYVNYSTSNTSETINNEVLENVISGSQRGIYLGETAAYTLVKGNEIFQNERGVLLFASDNNTFEDNVVYENTERGFDIVGSQDNEFTGNDVTGGTSQEDGFVLSTGVGGAANGRHSSGNVLSGNRIADHPGLNLHSTGALNGALALCNYWGTENVSNISNLITGPVMWAPYLIQDASGDQYPWDDTDNYICSSTRPYIVESGVAYATIQEAVNAADEDETVVIPSGWYGNDALDTSSAEDGLGFKFGASPGCVGIGEAMPGIVFGPTNKIYIDIEGKTHCYDDEPNAEYDQVFVNFGLINLGGAELIVNLDSDFTPEPGDQFHIFINNDSQIIGEFSNPPLIKVNGSYFVIQYNVELPGNQFAVTLTTVVPTFKLQIGTQQVPD